MEQNLPDKRNLREREENKIHGIMKSDLYIAFSYMPLSLQTGQTRHPFAVTRATTKELKFMQL